MRVLIVDDHPVVVSGCKALLAAEPGVEIFAAGDGESGFAAFCAHDPDVCVVDINLPGLSGFDLAQRILGKDADAKIVVFSMNEDPAFAARAIQAGARGYIAKNDDPMLFLPALKQVCDGGTWLPADLARKMAFARHPSPLENLSTREIEILRLLAAGDDMGDIADKLGVSYKTIANNCTALKAKLGARSSMDLLRAAIEVLR
ncbi:DNA-binding response regulator [Rhodoblastus sphagnicola]|uniref:DNA-binding response regulator n=1 Tax=Rhodoblastus sphagnicola TaxID=333368 RepID=A0A2S6N9S6_9HYPH|nr:response regulator transcription factor [Rhodoblastus sphagnicola]MBB4198192.1 DNA-binding NarL/FixJ family response regulator [Rhodoblastus sphagnicola]PPQ31372.1 DNA-binding response regulator [Rhodoblastus sphagnicola]